MLGRTSSMTTLTDASERAKRGQRWSSSGLSSGSLSLRCDRVTGCARHVKLDDLTHFMCASLTAYFWSSSALAKTE